MNHILETSRLILRELTNNDFYKLCESMQDKETMYAYEHAFTNKEIKHWLSKQQASYEQHGFGLWAVILKKENIFLGQCGITLQALNGTDVPEIGYIFSKKYWHNGYAIESARACKEHAFSILGFSNVYSIIRENNVSSIRVAQKNGMQEVTRIIKLYYQMKMPHIVYKVSRPL